MVITTYKSLMVNNKFKCIMITNYNKSITNDLLMTYPMGHSINHNNIFKYVLYSLCFVLRFIFNI